MNRLLIFIAAIAAVFAFSASPALAANSTCTDHTNNLTGWMISTDHIDTHWHFQCGGANNEDFFIGQALQFKNSSGVWTTADCPNGYLGQCVSFKPSTGWFNGGSDQSGDSGWNPSQQIDCKDWRMHTTVHFRGSSPDIVYNGTVQSIGGC